MRHVRAASRQPTRLFSDIDNHWSKDCVAELVKRGLIKGDHRGRFRPDAPITRGEFAVLMYWVFPRSLPVREPQPFLDIPAEHWASKVVRWVYERGLFSGYSDRTFRPGNTLTRSQALVVLVKGLNYTLPLFPDATLDAYFDDAADIPEYAKGAIATATLSGLVVNYPDVRRLRPNQPITRGEVAATLCQLFEQPQPIPEQYVTWSLGLENIEDETAIAFHRLKSNGRLTQQIQARLSAFKLYPDTAVTGAYTPLTEAALIDFCRILELPNRHTQQLDATLAQVLLTLEPVCFVLEQARDRTKVFNEYLQQEKGFGAAELAFLDKGIYGSPYEAEVKHYPAYLVQRPAAIETKITPISAVPIADAASPYPDRGKLPPIDGDRLSFLHADIQQACICLGQFENGQVKTRWLGRNALANVELWSATKIIPLLNVVSKVNSTFMQADVDNELIRPRQGSRGFRFYDLAKDIVNYKSAIGSSNSLAAMFKQFETPQNLERWLKSITGNTTLEFRGRYGEGAFIQVPELWDQRLQKVVLTAAAAIHGGNNSISTYDMTRLITMLAWHPYLPAEAQLPGAQWHSLESLIRAMGADSARYVDVAIARLGLSDVIQSPVIISKLGFGRSGIRHRTELVYSAFVQFVDTHQCQASDRVQLRSLGMTLIGAKKLGDGDREAVELDARMAAEVTEILRRVVTGELALG